MFIYPIIPLFGAFLFQHRSGPPRPAPFVPEVPERKKRKTPSEPPVPPVRRKRRPKKRRPKEPIITITQPPRDPRARLSLAKELAGSIAVDVRRKKYCI